MSDKKKIKTHRDKLTPKTYIKPVKVKVDESQRLREIRELVRANNRSVADDNLIISQIWLESSFDARQGQHQDAKGLMQMQTGAVKQVYKYRKQKELGHMPSDKATKQAFDEAAIFHKTDAIYDEATNIQLGTEYLQYLLDTNGSEEEAFKKYNGEPIPYYSKIKAAADRLKTDPDNMQILFDEVHK